MPSISFDRAADFYDATRGYAEGVAEQIRDGIVAYTRATLESRFLELGVGTGRIALPFIQAGYDFTGVDISQAMMERLEQKLTPNSNYRYQLQQADITQLPFSDNTFDIVYAVHVFHLVDGWQKAAQEAKRVLKPGGWLLVARDFQREDTAEAKNFPPALVRAKWDAIRESFGIPKHRTLPGVWGDDEAIVTYLQELGAKTELLLLPEHQNQPISAREMVTRLVTRIYSSDWDTPEDLHQQATLLLQKWLTEECPNPDEQITFPSQFQAITAIWE
jgi:SAM-dependent methyltransferase